ncbi:MAG: tetratricopeptide repeat protein [Prevotella sp.]|nr:tetratricopeptide repeat protein [Prevotella sp.]
MNRIVVILMMVMAGLVASAQADQKPLSSPIASQTKRQFDVLFHEALLQRQKGNLDAAFDLLQRCQELSPEAAETYYFLGEFYADMEQNEQALNAFRRACNLEPTNMTFLERMAYASIQAGAYGEGAEIMEQMYEADKSRQDLLETLYLLYMRQEDYGKAIATLDKLEAVDGPTERTTLAKCRIYIEQDNADAAISEMRQLAKHYPNDPTYRTLYANTLLVADHFDEAYDVLKQVLTEDSGDLRAQQVMRSYYIRQGDEAAADSVNHAILLNPKASIEDKVGQLRQIIIENEQQQGDSTVVLNLFNELLTQPNPSADIAEMKAAYMQLKEMPRDSVQQAFAYVLQLSPEQASARLRLVQQAWEDEDDDAVISLCSEARQYNPEEMVFYYYQGMAYYRQEDKDNALEAFRNGINVINEQSIPEIVSDFYAVMGDLLYQKGRQTDAFAAYDSCLVWKEDNIGCLNNYAYYLSLLGERLDEAEQMSYRTVKAEPENATYLDTYAWILFRQERYAEAKIYIEQALRDSLIDGVVKEHAGDIFALNGDIDKAMELWQQAQANDPDNKLLRRKIKRKKYFQK